MSSGQRQRTRAEFPRMKDRAGSRRRRRAARAEELSTAMGGVADAAAKAGNALGGMIDPINALVGWFRGMLAPSPERMRQSDFALMPAPLPGMGVISMGRGIHETVTPALAPLQADVWALPAAEISAIEHNQERYRQLMNLRRGQPSTYNQTEYR